MSKEMNPRLSFCGWNIVYDTYQTISMWKKTVASSISVRPISEKMVQYFITTIDEKNKTVQSQPVT